MGWAASHVFSQALFLVARKQAFFSLQKAMLQPSLLIIVAPHPKSSPLPRKSHTTSFGEKRIPRISSDCSGALDRHAPWGSLSRTHRPPTQATCGCATSAAARAPTSSGPSTAPSPPPPTPSPRSSASSPPWGDSHNVARCAVFRLFCCNPNFQPQPFLVKVQACL